MINQPQKYSKKVIAKAIAFSLISTMFITALLYNFSMILKYFYVFIDYLHNEQEAFVNTGMIILFFFNYLLFRRTFNLSGPTTFLFLTLSVILLDCTTFINGRSLIPLRFPFDTLFPILGITGGWIFTKTSRAVFVTYSAFVLFFLVLSHIYIIPNIINYMLNRDSENLEIVIRPDFFSASLKRTDGSHVSLDSLMSDQYTLLEFYFVGCKPCDEKYDILKNIKDKNLRIIYICNGAATPFDRFRSHAALKDSTGNSMFFYDSDSITRNDLKVTSFPFELLFRDRKLVRKFNGFNPSAAEQYVSDLEEIIKN